MGIFSNKDLEIGQKLLDGRRVVNIIFSGGTYQFEVLDRSNKRSKAVWPFVQMSDEGEVIDAFCSCKTAEKRGACEHLAASVLKVGGREPLHVRFRKSLWNQIGLMVSERHGYDVSCLREDGDRFAILSQKGKCLFSIWAKNPKTAAELRQLFFDRPVETEENSIKFSNLSAEELTLWQQGRPSPKLSYELSFWADLAKWWMLMQDGCMNYTISFSAEEPPSHINISFPDMEFSALIDKASWQHLIPALRHVDSPLAVHLSLQGELKGIIFSRAQGTFALDFEAEQKGPTFRELKERGIRVGDWFYFPSKGFYPREPDPLLDQKRIEHGQVCVFFDTYLTFIQKFLTGEKIHLAAHPVRYQMSFDPGFTLVVRAYLFEKGDLQQADAQFYRRWAYLPDRGFFRLEEPPFDEAVVRVPRNQISEFVGRHRVWLHNFEGFQTHVSGVESHLNYGFDKAGQLTFYTRLEFTEEAEKIQDLGNWIYVEGKGFYEKLLSRPDSYIKPGLTVASHKISPFIDRYREELEPIPGFFSPICPLEQSGLEIGFTADDKIQIDPQFFFHNGYGPSRVKIYGDYTYVEGEGFAPIPHDHRLPESYKVTQVIDQISESYFVNYELELLYPHVLKIDPRLERPQSICLRLNGLKIDRMGRWALEMDLETNIGTVCLTDVWKGIHSGQSYLFSKGGLLIFKDERFDWLRLKNKKGGLKKGATVCLSTLEFLSLTSSQDILAPEGDSKKAKETRKRLERFFQFQPPTPIDLEGLKSDLRAYQKIGVDWLWFLHAYGLSGLLCDEMGLGKTHQAMALIAGIRNEQKGKSPKFLVVCPTSVIYHWEKLIERFLPDVRAYIFHGIGRRFEAFSEGSSDLLLTSYGIVRTENRALAHYPFDLVVFDELQMAKNEKSQTHRALKNLDAKMRLGLSGTPIENRLLELKALFDLIVPGYFPSMKSFRGTFVVPIEKEQDEEKQMMLSRLIRPFLLRRKKSEVLTELPEKFEEVILCDLSEEQQRLYRQIVAASRDALVEELQDASKSPPIAHIFSMLSKLKQVCNHPALVLGKPKHYKQHASGKWELFLELFEETRDSGQKLVIFSQYLGMLDIFGMHLAQHGIEYAEIRGSTRDRKRQVEQFDQDPKCEVLLGSLQAAGVGIDLIAASVVILYDRWWNPAKEDQAIARVHRIGQKRGVQVFKLVAKNTIEEHIHQLIEKKVRLAGGVIGFDGKDQVKGLTRQELIELLHLLK